MLAYHQFGAAVPPADPATTQPALQLKPPVIQAVKVKQYSLSLINALTIGVVTGFAMSLGTFLFESLKRKH